MDASGEADRAARRRNGHELACTRQSRPHHLTTRNAALAANGNSAEARRWRKLREELLAGRLSRLRATEDELTAEARLVVDQTCTLMLRAEQLRAALLRGEAVDDNALVRLTQATERHLSRLDKTALLTPEAEARRKTPKTPHRPTPSRQDQETERWREQSAKALMVVNGPIRWRGADHLGDADREAVRLALRRAPKHVQNVLLAPARIVTDERLAETLEISLDEPLLAAFARKVLDEERGARPLLTSATKQPDARHTEGEDHDV